MPAPATVGEFLDLVRKSGVVEDKRLEAFLLKSRDRIPPDPRGTAKLLIEGGVLTHFQADNILAGKWRRFSIGKYKVLEKLGSGGMGQVYLCEHKLMRRRVAVKVLPIPKAKESSALERFYREARAAAALDHPNIVHAYDIDQDEDLHFLVMEYVDGANLQDIVRKSGPLPVLRACHYIFQAAHALQHAHEAGLVHRDIKPGNILVDRSGLVKILDMGLARFFHDEDDVLTKKYDDGVLGTADYLAPEQALDSHAVDIRADIYSLGATFYYLLTGRPPFESANVTQKLMMHQFRAPKPLVEYRKDVPAELEAILQKMLAKEPAQRYTIPAELVEALAPFTQEPIAPPSASELPRLSPAASGHLPVLGAAETVIGKNSTPLSRLPTLPGSTSGTAKGSGAVVYAPPRSAPAAIATPGPGSQATPVVKPAAKATPQEVLEIQSWESMASDTDNPSAKADTTEQSAQSVQAVKTPLISFHRRSLLMLILLAAAILVPLMVVGSTALAIWWFYPNSANQQQPAPTSMHRPGR